MYSKNFKNLGIIEFNLDNLVYDKKDDWANYPKGVIKTFLDRNYKIDSGFDVLFLEIFLMVQDFLHLLLLKF